MKNYFFLLIALCTMITGHGLAQEGQSLDEKLQGAWKCEYTDADGIKKTISSIIMDGFIAHAEYTTDKNEFSMAWGGSYKIMGNTLIQTTEFNSSDTSAVGNEDKYVIKIEDNMLSVEGIDLTWLRIDDGKPGSLAGAWLFSGRKRNGEMSRRNPGPRKTMKILSGTRFQWIAYHTGTGRFSGTGGGTYITENGKYTENIDFFSRDNSRVGASLEFNFELIDGEWHHSGFSSKGDPMYELWAEREK